MCTAWCTAASQKEEVEEWHLGCDTDCLVVCSGQCWGAHSGHLTAVTLVYFAPVVSFVEMSGIQICGWLHVSVRCFVLTKGPKGVLCVRVTVRVRVR